MVAIITTIYGSVTPFVDCVFFCAATFQHSELNNYSEPSQQRIESDEV